MIKISILYYESSSGYGGSANALANLVNFLDKIRFTSIILIKNLGPQVKKINSVEIIKLPDYQEPKETDQFRYLLHFITKIIPEAIKIFFIIKKRNISLVHINTDTITGLAPLIAAKLAGSLCVTHVRGTMNLLKRQIILLKWINKFIIVNTKAHDIYAQYIPESKLSLIYDGIDLQDFSNPAVGIFRNEFCLSPYQLIGIVGRVVEGKGQKEFVLVAKKIINTNNNVKFLIIGDAMGGDNKYIHEVKLLIAENSLEQYIILTGWRNDMKNIIADLDILVQATTTFPEGFGLTIIEAMALSKPVVATDIPGPRDIVLNGVTGYLVPPGDIEAMAEKTKYLLDNPHNAKRMGEAGRKRVEEIFKIEVTVHKIEKIYNELLSRKK